MEVTFERRKSVAARWSWRVAVFSAVLFVVAGAGHRYGFVETVPFIAVLGLVAALALLSVLLAAIGMARLWQRGDKGGRAAAKALALVLVVLAPFAWGAFRIATLPMIHDIATDPLNPPLFSQLAGRSGAYVNPISPITPEQAERQMAAYPTITGRRFVVPVDRVLDVTLAALANMRWRVVGKPVVEEGAGEITVEAVAPSLVLGFVSDVAIRITDEGDTTFVDVRSSARYGRHDLGDDATKIERFFAAFDEDLALRSTPANREN